MDYIQDWHRALRWLKRNKDSKFFMFLHTYHVHDPYTQDKSALRRFPAASHPVKTMKPEEAAVWIDVNISTHPGLEPFAKALKDHPEIFAMSDLHQKRAAVLDLMKPATGNRPLFVTKDWDGG